MTISSIQQIIQNLSKEELNTEILLSTYFQGTSTSASSENVFDGDENLASGEILPWGVKALWKGNDYSQTGNFGEEFDENGDFEGSYAFVIDSGVSKTTGDLNLSPDVDDGGWSKSFVGSEPDPFDDGNGHGSHVAGTIAAKVNGKGVIGVAPGALVTSLKVFNASGGGASYATVLNAIEYAAEIIIDNNLPTDKSVINLSLGGPLSPSINTAVKNLAAQGIQFAIAAGNETQDADNVSPAGAGDAENVWTVSASDIKNKMAWFSNWDNQSGGDDVDVAAPGVNVKSYYKNDQLANLNGTSMAAPGVAGLLITGGLVEGNDVIANSGNNSDPFALTANDPTEEEEEEEEEGNDGGGDDGQDDGNEEDGQDDGNEDDGQDDGNEDDEQEDEDDEDDEQEDEDDEDGEDEGDGGNDENPEGETIEYVGNAEGEYGSFFMSSGYGSVSQNSLESDLEISSGTLDGTLEFAEDTEGSKAASNATEGSGIKITGTANVGDSVNFEYAFISNDYVPYEDYSFYSINDQTFALGAIGGNVEDFGTKIGEVGYTFDSTDFGGEDSGNYTISFGVVDSKDQVVDSYLAISDFYIDDGSEEENSDDDGNFVESPDYTFEYEEYGDALGDNGAFDLTTGGEAKKQYFIEKFLDLDNGTLDGSLGSTKGAINATEGSAIMATTNAFVGDVITFDYSFSTNDYQPYKDFSFFSINGNTQKIAAVGEDTPNFGNNVGQIEYVLKDSDFENIDESNEVVLGIGIMDALDTWVDSSLSIMNIEISEGVEEGDDVDEESEDEPEEGDLNEPVTYGNVTVENDTYTLSTGGNNTVSQNDLEQNLGLISNILDSNLNSTKGAINATEGSAMQGDGVGKVGDTISFDYEFSTNDYTPFKDFSFYSVNNKAYKIAAIGEDVENKGSTSGTISYTFVESDFGGSSFGEYKFGVGVMDALDAIVDTTLTVSEFTYSEGAEGAEEEESNDIDLTVSTYGDSYKAGDKWKMSTGYGAISQNSLETSLLITSEGGLDAELTSIDDGNESPKESINATEGSGLLATTDSAAVGDKFTFNYTFDTNDYEPYNDFSFLSINGTTLSVAAVSDENVGNFGSFTGSYEKELEAGDFDENGVLNIGLGVVDAIDTAVTSKFSVWDLTVTSGVGEGEDGGETVEGGDDDDTIEEPADSESTGEIEFQGFGNAFNSSSGMISMSTGYGSVSQFVVEENSGLDLGALDGDLNSTKEALNATEGSGITATFGASAGDIVSFDYEFKTDDYIPYQDFSFISVNGEAQALAVVGVDTPDFGKTTGKYNYTLTNEDINKSGGGNVQFSVGIMDAWDTCVTSSLKLYDFKVSSAAAVESDFSGKGLIDGLDAYMASESVTEIKNEDGQVTTEGTILKLSAAGNDNSDGQTLGEDTSDNWNIGGLTKVFSLTSFGGFETLGVGTGSNNGKVAIWTTDSNGEIIDEDIDTLDDSEAWVSIAEATANGYEEKFGKDLDLDGLVSSGDGSNEGVVLKNSSDSFDNVALTDANGQAISQAGTETFTVEKAIASQGFQLFNASATGYQVLVEGQGDKFGEVGVVEVDGTGQMTGEVTWQSSDDFSTIENLFGSDIDGNKLISSSTTYQLLDNDNKKVVLKSNKGVAYNDETNNIWDAKASATTQNGNIVLLEGEDGGKKDGKYSVMITNANGVATGLTAWQDASTANSKGWENTFNTDLDYNGLITGGDYKASSETGSVLITNKNGISYNDGSSKNWDFSGASQVNNGFKVLLSGEEGKFTEDKLKLWKTSKEGVLQFSTGWKDTSNAIELGWEYDFDADFDNNGLITGSAYKVATSKESITITNKNGATFKDQTSSNWNASAATEVSSGFKVMLAGEDGGSKEGQYALWKTSNEGVIQFCSAWQESDAAVSKGWENDFDTDIDGNGLITGGNYKVATSKGAVLITAKNGNTFSDSTGLLWDATAAVESEKGFQILLAGDQDKQNSGQVKLMSANKEGVVYKISGWQDQQEFLDENDAFSSVSLPDYFESEPENELDLNALISKSLISENPMPSTDLLTGLSTSNTDSNDDTDEVINSSLEDASSGSSDQLDANGVLSSNSDNTYTVETTTIEPGEIASALSTTTDQTSDISLSEINSAFTPIEQSSLL